METAVVRKLISPQVLHDPQWAYRAREDTQRRLYAEMDHLITERLKDGTAHVVQYFAPRRDSEPGPWGATEVWELRAIVMPVAVQRGDRIFRAFQHEADWWSTYWDRQAKPPRLAIGDMVRDLEAQLDALADGRQHVFVTVGGQIRAYRRKRLSWKRIW
jgi:hypothetical protein